MDETISASPPVDLQTHCSSDIGWLVLVSASLMASVLQTLQLQGAKIVNTQ
jgi:hypothetical protein